MSTLTLLSESVLDQLGLTGAQILEAVQSSLIAQSQNRALSAPTTVFHPVPGREGLIAVVQGSFPEQGLAAVKTVGGFPGNAASGMATNPGCVLLIDAYTGQMRGIISAAMVTTLRTAAVSALGARYLAGDNARILGCIGSRGVALQSVRFIADLLDLDEIRLHSRNISGVEETASTLSGELGIPVKASKDWQSCLEGADIMIEGASLHEACPLFPAEVLAPGATLIAYGTYSSMPSDIMHHLDRVFVDRWAEGGAFGPQVEAGELRERDLSGTIGQVIDGRIPARTDPLQRVLFWHRGLAASDIALCNLMLSTANEKGLGDKIRF